MMSSPPNEIQLSLAQAQDALNAGRMDEAAQLGRQILSKDPAHTGALHILGLVALAGGRNDDALQLLEQAAGLDRGDALLHMRLGIARALNKQYESAIATLEFAARLVLRPTSTTFTSILRLHWAS